jgi:hypothetical protein
LQGGYQREDKAGKRPKKMLEDLPSDVNGEKVAINSNRGKSPAGCKV